MAGVLERGLITLQNEFNLLEIVLPFILVFVIIYAVLNKTNILGEPDKAKKFNVMIALVMGLIVVFQHYFFRGPGRSVVQIINNSLPQIAIVAIAIVMLMLILGVLTGKSLALGNTNLGGWVMILAAVFVGYIFLAASGVNTNLWGYRWIANSREIVSIVVAILIFALVIGYVTGEKKDGENPKKGAGQNFAETLFGGN